MPKPRHPWYQFSLRSFLVLVTLACAGFGWWVHRSREWIRERCEWRESHGWPLSTERTEATTAPGGLWLFGEAGIETIAFDGADEGIEEFSRLFPETRIHRGATPVVGGSGGPY